jgi:hypothetical protein
MKQEFHPQFVNILQSIYQKQNWFTLVTSLLSHLTLQIKPKTSISDLLSLLKC